jgi:hypothetical protein
MSRTLARNLFITWPTYAPQLQQEGLGVITGLQVTMSTQILCSIFLKMFEYSLFLSMYTYPSKWPQIPSGKGWVMHCHAYLLWLCELLSFGKFGCFFNQ